MKTTSNYPEWVDATERQIIDCLIDTILGAGYLIQVYDYEADDPAPRLSDKAAIRADVGQMDETVLRVWEKDGFYKGRILLIHGNGTDVISDHTDTPFMESMVRPAMDLADGLPPDAYQDYLSRPEVDL